MERIYDIIKDLAKAQVIKLWNILNSATTFPKRTKLWGKTVPINNQIELICTIKYKECNGYFRRHI